MYSSSLLLSEADLKLSENFKRLLFGLCSFDGSCLSCSGFAYHCQANLTVE